MMMTMKKSLLMHKTQEVEVEKNTAMNNYTTASGTFFVAVFHGL